MKKKIYLTAIHTIIISLLGFSQDSLILKNIIAIGLENNYGIQIQELNQEIASTNNHWGNTGALPSINLGINSANKQVFYPSADASFDNGRIENADYTQNVISGGISANWIIFNGLQAHIRKDKLNTLEAISEGNAQAMIESSLQAMILAYYKVLLEREKLKVYETQLQLSADRYEYDKLRKEYGRATTYDLLQSQNAMLQDKTNFITQEYNSFNALNDLKLIIGMPDSVKLHVKGELPAIFNDYIIDDLILSMTQNNKNIRTQYLNIELMEKEKQLALRELYYPKLTVSTGLEYSIANMNYKVSPNDIKVNSESWNYYGNFALSFNLYGGGQKRRATKIAEINTQIAEIKTTEMVHTLNNQLLKLIELYNIRKELYNLTNEVYEASKLNYEMTEERYKQGLINSFNFRDVQKMYLETAIKQKEALYYLIQTDTDLLRITGRIIEQN